MACLLCITLMELQKLFNSTKAIRTKSPNSELILAKTRCCWDECTTLIFIVLNCLINSFSYSTPSLSNHLIISYENIWSCGFSIHTPPRSIFLPPAALICFLRGVLWRLNTLGLILSAWMHYNTLMNNYRYSKTNCIFFTTHDISVACLYTHINIVEEKLVCISFCLSQWQSGLFCIHQCIITYSC